MKGARIGVNARGKRYLHLGRGGFYYRETLPDTSQVTGQLGSADSGISWGVVLLVLIAAAFLYEFFAS